MELDIRQRQILSNMKSTLLTAGWQKDALGVLPSGKLDDDAYGVCLYGALIASGGISARKIADPSSPAFERRNGGSKDCPTFVIDDNPDLQQVLYVLALEAGCGTDRLAVWNDEPTRTLDDVIDLIDRTLARAESAPDAREESNAAGRARTRTAV